MPRLWVLLLLWQIGLCALPAPPARAAEVQVAVAANFAEPAKAVAAAFAAATGHHAVLSLGASGQFYAQIAHGAPFEVFLSADVERPARLEADGLLAPQGRFTYAVGKLVLYSRTPHLADGGRVLQTGGFDRLAVADPALAPYGAAAVQVLQKLGVYEQLKPKLAFGANITQTYQYVATGAAEVGFVALSQVIHEPAGSRWSPPQALYAPIEQQAALLKPGAANPAAVAFFAYLQSPAARRIIQSYGYEVR